VRQAVDSGFDDQWNQRSHGLSNDQADESRNEARLVARKVRPKWTEAVEHPNPYDTNPLILSPRRRRANLFDYNGGLRIPEPGLSGDGAPKVHEALEILAGCVYDGAALGRSASEGEQVLPQGAPYGE
jgi:hypothetical protein